MKTENPKLLSYAMDFASFLIQKIKEKENIKNIILFGSVAREEAEPSSDIDLFIDVIKENSKTELELNKILEQFLSSVKCRNYWNLLNVKNEIKLTIGNLNNWKSLKPSIIANGIALYGKFKTDIKEGRHKTFFVWENIRPNSKRVLFNKQLFGYKQNNKFYPGILQKYQGEKLGKGCILVDLETAQEFHKLFKKHSITVRIKKVLDYS